MVCPVDDHPLSLKACFDVPHLPLDQALECALVALKEVGLDTDRYMVQTNLSSDEEGQSHETYAGSEAVKLLRRSGVSTFFVHPVRDGEGQVIHVSPPFPRRPFQGLVVSAAPGLGLDQFRRLVEKVSRLGALAFAGVDESTYFAWQRCTKIGEYLKRYGSIEGFKINTLADVPPEIARMLDTSKNPGSMLKVNGLSVFAAADMWLGSAFWNYAPCTKEEVLKEPWLEVEDTENYLYLKAYPQAFTRPEGEQGRLQRRIWNVLFHQDCEWPPGSGGISDVPIGGPPEIIEKLK